MTSANSALRFLLELSALTAFALLMWTMAEGFWRVVGAVLVVGGIAAVWGVFAVPGDPSRSGGAPVRVPGHVRLLLELSILGGAGPAFFAAGLPMVGGLQVALVALHYVLSADRIEWLLQH